MSQRVPPERRPVEAAAAKAAPTARPPVPGRPRPAARRPADDVVDLVMASLRTGPVVQREFDGPLGEWMQKVDDKQLKAKFGVTTRALWSALRKSEQPLQVKEVTSGATYNFETKALAINRDWYDAIKSYVVDGTKGDNLARGIAALTHEMSHAHDHLELKQSPFSASSDDDSRVVAVLKTELKAWMKEARSARENSKEKGIKASEDDNRLIFSWLAVWFLLREKSNVLAHPKDNLVVGRLQKYFKDNRSKKTKTTLAGLLTDTGNGLQSQIVDYAKEIRGKFETGDEKLRAILVQHEYL